MRWLLKLGNGEFMMAQNGLRRKARTVLVLTSVLLVIEALDEAVGGVMGAAYPSMRTDLHLSYVDIGLLLAIPNTVSSAIEPVLGILADFGHRRALILGGGVGFAIALLLLSGSTGFGSLLAAFILLYPASGAFVSLSQAALMDLEPMRHEQNMARWTLAGSIGDVAGPLLLAIAVAAGQSWRSVFLALALLTLSLVIVMGRSRTTVAKIDVLSDRPMPGIRATVRHVTCALTQKRVLRWLTLLQFSDLMLDVLRGFLALYMVDVVGSSNGQASVAFAVWIGFGMVGDALLIPLLERVKGLSYLRVSAFLVLGLYPAFLLLPGMTAKMVLLGALGFLNAGWYAILQGRLYTAMPGQSGTVMALNNLAGTVGGLIPLMIGAIAQRYGLESAMWLLLAAPIALIIGCKDAG